jgi:acyl-CoA thioester hydrolase
MSGSDTNFLTDPGAFRLWTRDVLRFADTDRLGHINNAAFATFCESGRVAFIWDPDAPLAQPGRAFVIVRLVIDFRAELHWPGAVDIGTTVLRIGNRSFALGQGLFKDGACVATAETTLVILDEATRRAMVLPDDVRARLDACARNADRASDVS